ncbi:DUF2259 domain-containing protein [Corticibacterium sp. UT-5YL-CI-8]|nr:DUF2259 domain-containing protein [Tianweitania sp. UT-5YL-CI-8]
MKNVGSAMFISAVLLASVVPGLAGDTADLSVLGFSADGKVFAFEEYGIQDGSGFPYSNRFYVNIAEDDFVAGTPIRVLFEDETKPLYAVRAQAGEKGNAILSNQELGENPGFLAGFNAVTEVSADPYHIVVNPRPVFPPIDANMEFRLEEFSLKGPDFCDGVAGPTKGYRLIGIDAKDSGKTQVLHEDTSIPQSRGCANGYRIGGVQTFFTPDSKMAYAVLITVVRQGFEGPDHRWIANTGYWAGE